MQHLQPNTYLQGGRYKIISTLGQGGFGITYLAIQRGLERKVAIKEFFMKELCDRDENTSHVTLGTTGSRETVNRFREKFLKEARNIAKLNHPNIVRVIDVFEENDTAYYVMEYAENGSLADKVAREGYLSESVASRYILQVAEALNYIHEQKMNHLDVKPANIMLNEKDEAVLIDFGLCKQYDAVTGDAMSTNIAGLSEGYAPLEQYDGTVKAFAPEIDVYALGATFFKMLTGNTPPAASIVNNEGVPLDELKTRGVSNGIVAVIEKAMEGRKKDRCQSVFSFVETLKKKDSNDKSSIINEPIADETTRLIGDASNDLSNQDAVTKKKEDNKPVLNHEIFDEENYRIPAEYLSSPLMTQKKADADNLDAIIAYGMMCLRGINLNQDFDAAYSWFLKSKDLGDTRGEQIVKKWNDIKYKYYQKTSATETNDEKEDEFNLKVAIIIVSILFGLFVAFGLYSTCGSSSDETEIDTLETDTISTDTLLVSFEELDENSNGCYEVHFPVEDEFGRDIYLGQVKDGLFDDDNAFLSYSNGDIFTGEFRAGKRIEGRLEVSSDGTYYEGKIENDTKPSYGSWYTKDGVLISVIKNGNEYK